MNQTIKFNSIPIKILIINYTSVIHSWFNAYSGVILLSGSNVKHLCIKSLAYTEILELSLNL